MSVKSGWFVRRVRSHVRIWFGLLMAVFALVLVLSSSIQIGAADLGVVNVLDYGAKGDGVTNDWQAITDAMNAGAASGKPVYLPAGKYRVLDALVPPDGVTIQGAGPTSMIYLPEVGQGARFIFQKSNPNNVTIRDLKLVGDGYTKQQSGLYLYGARDSTLKNLTFENLWYGMKLGDGYRQAQRWNISDITATKCRMPMYIQDVEDSTFTRLSLQGMKVDAGFDHCIYMSEGSFRLTFTDVTLIGGGGYGLHLYSSSGGPSSDITFNNLTVDARTGRQPMCIADGFSNITFNNLTSRMSVDEVHMRLSGATNITFDGLTASGGYAFIGTWNGDTAGRVTIKNGNYDGPVLLSPVSGEQRFELISQNVTVGPAGSTPTTAATTTTAPPVMTTTTVRATTTTTVRPTTTTAAPATTTTAPVVTTTTARPTTTTVRPTTTTAAPTTTTSAPVTTTTSRPAFVPPATTTTMPLITSTTLPATTTTTTPPAVAVPQVVISKPVDGSIVGDKTGVLATVTSSVPAAKVRFSANGRPIATDLRAPFAFSWNTKYLLGSTVTLAAAAYDSKGALIGQSSVRVTIARRTSSSGARTAAWTPAIASPFWDLDSGSSYAEAVVTLAESSVVEGFDDGTFGADLSSTRAQVAKMVCGTLGIADGELIVTPFVDLDPMDVFLYPHKFVAALVGVGAVEGTSPTVFSPWQSVTRAQLVSIVARALLRLDPNSLAQPPAGYASTVGSFSPSHDQNMRLAEYNGLLEGLDGFGPAWDPWVRASRGEVAQILFNVASLK